MISTFLEKQERFSEFLLFSESKSQSQSEAVEQKVAVPELSFLRVECKRVHAGMSDFVIRVSTPEYDGVKSNTVISIRGGKQMAKYEVIEKMAKTIALEMEKREDKTFKWGQLNAEHLAGMLLLPIKFFAQSINVSTLQFSTEALTR